jgi:hypothetical protein
MTATSTTEPAEHVFRPSFWLYFFAIEGGVAAALSVVVVIEALLGTLDASAFALVMPFVTPIAVFGAAHTRWVWTFRVSERGVRFRDRRRGQVLVPFNSALSVQTRCLIGATELEIAAADLEGSVRMPLFMGLPAFREQIERVGGSDTSLARLCRAPVG